ncbi:MAG: hypothetical protein P4L55_09865 [Syntrophobacteraceae bacterium]|nr:hypothetical protein [Syntrophobacteraceae bacterium]
MPTIFTCGGPGKATQFTYDGDLESGIVITYAYRPVEISPRFLKTAIENFKGRKVKGGFSMTDPPADGFGDWVKNQSKILNKKKEEEGVKSSFDHRLEFLGLIRK